MSAAAQRAGDRLDLQLTAHAVPRAFRCSVLAALEDWIRDEKDHGGLLTRIGMAFALEAVKHVRARRCPKPLEEP